MNELVRLNLLNIIIERLVLFLYVIEVLGLVLGLDVGCSEGFEWFLSVFLGVSCNRP